MSPQHRGSWLGMSLCLWIAGCGQATFPVLSTPDAITGWQTAPATAASAPEVKGISWQLATPADHLDKDRWWHVYGDETLNALQQQALDSSPSLRAAEARWMQARAVLDAVGATQGPRLDGVMRGARSRTSANRPAATSGGQSVSSIQNDYVMQGVVSYELDLFGRQRFERLAAEASAEQARADLNNACLVLSAELASAYFGIRSLDHEMQVVRQGLALQERSAGLLRARHEEGVASGLDVAQQQALIDATRVQLTLLEKQRSQLEHALASLSGQSASQFRLAPASGFQPMASLPVSVPSQVLQRRPDVASAERGVAQAQAQWGVAQRAWFPSVSLNATSGWQSKDLAQMFDPASLIWSLGAGVVQTLWDGGRNTARQAQAQAQYDAAVAAYGQVVLRAFQEVEDGLTHLNALDQALRESDRAAQSAQRVLDIAQARYAGGVSTYLDVVTAQQGVLNNQRLRSQLQGQQRQAVAYLVKALGGGW